MEKEKKNKSLRMASGIFILVLLTTCVIGATFAKYTTQGTGGDTARVAQWGVTVETSGNLFGASYDKHQTDNSGDTITVSDTATVSVKNGSSDGKNVVAPGTKNDAGITMRIEGTPEVMVAVETQATLSLENWEIPAASGTGTEEYCPIVITVDGKEYKMGTVAGDCIYTTISDFEQGVEEALSKTDSTVAPNTNLANTYDHTVAWKWAFEGTDGSYQTNAKDTALGNLSTAPTIEFNCSATVTQVD